MRHAHDSDYLGGTIAALARQVGVAKTGASPNPEALHLDSAFGSVCRQCSRPGPGFIVLVQSLPQFQYDQKGYFGGWLVIITQNKPRSEALRSTDCHRQHLKSASVRIVGVVCRRCARNSCAVNSDRRAIHSLFARHQGDIPLNQGEPTASSNLCRRCHQAPKYSI